ncbi:uncharacterized protein IUM83_12668 [Phytophthora cinnamomi]|uniref:uncharacterized protein n=1 Tax=Phytophthora cinnamomi TaxID=4785 RepID=UPI00355A9E27|nr:hypothetical protein IUM83_12668 [Phytophthora cinnamomi]
MKRKGGSSTEARKSARSEKTGDMTRAGRIPWDSDGVGSGKSSLRVVLDWLAAPGNYDKWSGSDRSNGNTKEALLKGVLLQLEAAGIKHRNGAGVRDKISNLEKQYREAVAFSAGCETADTDKDALRAAVLRRCPHYYELRDVMTNRPKDTSDDVAAATIINSLQRLLSQQAAVLRAYEEQRMIQEREHRLKERELQLKEQELKLKEEASAREKAHVEIELTLKRVELETAKREAMVHLLLSRKKLEDNDVAQDMIDRLLPLP